MKSFRIAILSTCALAALSQAALADTTSDTPDKIETVVVTALKRIQSVQAVPAAVTALSGAGLEERGITDIQGLQFAVPSVETGALLGDTQITIRGIGNGPGGPSTAIYVDGVYQPIAALADLSAIDMARVEVLRGPQGTLYGRNANGGAVNFISNAPTQDFGGNVSAQYESYNEYTLQGVVNVPLSSTIAARAVINYDDREDGFIKNVSPGAPDLDKGKVLSGRLRIAGEITDNLTFDINLQGKHDEGPFQYYSLITPDPSFILALGAVVPSAPWKTSATGPAGTNENYGVGAITLDWNSPFGDLKSITAYQAYNINALTDQDATNIDVYNNLFKYVDHTFTQELNLSTQIGPVDSIFGAFYMNEKGERDSTYFYGTAIGGPAVGDYQLPRKDTDSRAIYFDLTWHVTDQLRLIGGARYTEDRLTYAVKQFDPFAPPFPLDVDTCPTTLTKLQFDSTTGKVGAQYDVADKQNIYGTVSTGYLSGGLNELNCPSQNTYKPEKITSYEVGYKSILFDDHVVFNVAGFYYDFTDLQVTQLVSNGGPVSTRETNNAASSTVKGAELETDWVPDSHWTIGFNVTYLDARYDKYFPYDNLTGAVSDAAGNRLNNAPGFSGNLSTAYRTDEYDWGGLLFRADVAARSRIYFRPFNEPADSQTGYGVLNLSATWNSPDDVYSVRVFDNNVTDQAYIVTQDSSPGLGRYITYGNPNQYGIQLKANF
jgi:iron complex outermembrane receptor protein